MRFLAEIIAIFDAPTQMHVTPSDKIEISLDCSGCQRTGRTVIFRKDSNTGMCTPTLHSFPGNITQIEAYHINSQIILRYSITYNTHRFIDRKHEKISVIHPTWARVHFTSICPQCHRENEHSSQNNIRRPSYSFCECGFTLFNDRRENPQFRVRSKYNNLLYQSTISTITINIFTIDIDTGVLEYIAALTNNSVEGIRKNIHDMQPVYTQDIYNIKEPVTFSQDLELIVFKLISYNVDFDVFRNGRSIKTSYIRRMKNNTD